MNFELKILIPLVGVILGWILASVTSLFKVRGEKRRLLGMSISQLYYLIHELKIVFYHLEKIKDEFPMNQWEDHRQKAIERYTLKNEDSLSRLNQLIENISSISPMLGIELKFLIETFFFDRKVKLDSSKHHKKLYVLLLSVLETSQSLTTTELEKVLIKLSFKYSLLTGFRIKRKLKKSANNLNTRTDILPDKLYSLMKPKPQEQ